MAMGYGPRSPRRRRPRGLRRSPRTVTVPRTGYANYTVRQAAEDWLANGLDGRSARTIKKN